MTRRFFNPHAKATRRTIFDVLLWKLGHYADPAPPTIPEDFVYPAPKNSYSSEDPSVIWINHSTALIEINGLRLLTDPIWSPRCSPFSCVGPKRKHPPGLAISELPKIDLVLISHDHYDHLDKSTIKALHAKFPDILWLVPMGVKEWFLKRGIAKVKELGWWEESSFTFPTLELKATGVPAQHFSGRSAVGINPTLWMGWVVEFTRANGEVKCLYFVGDTGYNPYDFKAIGARWKTIDLSLIPIGSYSPRKFMKSVHVDPEESVRIHNDVRSKLSLGIHWKTFDLSDEPMNQPPYDLFCALQHNTTQFLVLPPGQKTNW
ncbi:MAG: MBL fold metallo-hydrolase [Chlamydiales bacterium]